MTMSKEYIEYITKHRSKHFVCSFCSDYFPAMTCEGQDTCEWMQYIETEPAADVVEVKHGHWIEHEWAEESEGLLISNFECSQCHDWERKTSDYCPNCGSKMDGE